MPQYLTHGCRPALLTFDILIVSISFLPTLKAETILCLSFCLRNLSAQHVHNRNLVNIDQTNKLMHQVLVISSILECLEKGLSGFVQLRSGGIYF